MQLDVEGWMKEHSVIQQSPQQDNTSSTSTNDSNKIEKKKVVGSKNGNSRMDLMVKMEVADQTSWTNEFVPNPLSQRRQSPRYLNKPRPNLAESVLSKRVTTSNAIKEYQLATEEIRRNEEIYQQYLKFLKTGQQFKTEIVEQSSIQVQPQVKTEKKKRGRPFKKERKEEEENNNKDEPLSKRGRQMSTEIIEQSQIKPLPQVVKTEKKKRGRPCKKEIKEEEEAKINLEIKNESDEASSFVSPSNSTFTIEKKRPATREKGIIKKLKIERRDEASTSFPFISNQDVENLVEKKPEYSSPLSTAGSSSSDLKPKIIEKQHKVIFGRDDFVESIYNASIKNPTGFESLELWIGPVKTCHRPKLATTINNILKSSADTLIKITRFEPVLRGQKIPVMEKLESLRFSHWTGSLKAPLLPRDCDPQISFPKLTEVYLDHLGYGRGKWEDFFPRTRVCHEVIFPTVKTLKLNLDASNFLEKVAIAFPNCKNLSFEFMFYEFPEKAGSIWENFPQLEYLKIQRKVVQEDNKKFTFDVAFTGFDKETCSRLFSFPSRSKSAVISNERKNPSIIKLKNLKQLVLDLYIWDYKGPTGITALSKVSGLYAFEMMPELEVKLITRYMENEGLMTGFDSISPFIQTVTRG